MRQAQAHRILDLLSFAEPSLQLNATQDVLQQNPPQILASFSFQGIFLLGFPLQIVHFPSSLMEMRLLSIPP